jgi:hypothetical protein
MLRYEYRSGEGTDEKILIRGNAYDMHRLARTLQSAAEGPGTFALDDASYCRSTDGTSILLETSDRAEGLTADGKIAKLFRWRAGRLTWARFAEAVENLAEGNAVFVCGMPGEIPVEVACREAASGAVNRPRRIDIVLAPIEEAPPDFAGLLKSLVPAPAPSRSTAAA